jgi:hypothetical protein
MFSDRLIVPDRQRGDLETGDRTCRPAAGAAAPGMEEGPMPPYPPSPVARRRHRHSVPLGFLRPQLVAWFVSCVPGRCSVGSWLCDFCSSGGNRKKGSWAGPLGK